MMTREQAIEALVKEDLRLAAMDANYITDFLRAHYGGFSDEELNAAYEDAFWEV